MREHSAHKNFDSWSVGSCDETIVSWDPTPLSRTISQDPEKLRAPNFLEWRYNVPRMILSGTALLWDHGILRSRDNGILLDPQILSFPKCIRIVLENGVNVNRAKISKLDFGKYRIQ